MAKTFRAQLDDWARKTKERTEVVTKQATNDMLKNIEIVPGVNRGGARIGGTIPRDTGALAASLQSTLRGSTTLSGQGADSYALIVGAMETGDVATFAWGGPAAAYAQAVHYGANGVPGTFWIDEAAAGWQGYVSAAVARAKGAV